MENKLGEPETDPLGCGSLYLVFDYVEHDLAGLIDIKYKFPAKAVKYIAKQLFEALHFLHDRRIIHRVSFHCIYVMYIYLSQLNESYNIHHLHFPHIYLFILGYQKL